MSVEKREKMQVTIQTKLNSEASEYLDKAAIYIASLRGKLLKELIAGKNINELKKKFLAEHGLLARQFNSLHSEVKGMIKSVQELRKLNVKDAERRRKNLQQQIKKLSKTLKQKLKKNLQSERQLREKYRFMIHHKNRKLRNTEHKIAKLKERGICLGSRKLFLKQFNLEENGYENHQEWLQQFKDKRTNRIFFIGSKDEMFGNQNCQLLGNTLQVRVIPKLAEEFGRHVNIPVEFHYKEHVIRDAIANEQAINYRFVRQNDNWYVFVTTRLQATEKITRRQCGAIGIDLNHSHIAYAETNRHGNLVHHGKINTPIQDRSSEQVTAMLSEAIKTIVQRACHEQKPIVIEKLDFAKKKAELCSQKVRYRRIISYFAYNKFASLVHSKAYRAGVEVIVVNPVFSSVIGKYKFAHFLGISTHIAASLVLARRAQNFSERLPAGTARCLPVDRHCHVWKLWKAFHKIAVSNRERLVEFLFCSRHLPF